MLFNELEINVVYSINVTSKGIPPGRDKSGQVIEPGEGVEFTIVDINIDQIKEQVREHAEENIYSMLEELDREY